MAEPQFDLDPTPPSRHSSRVDDSLLAPFEQAALDAIALEVGPAGSARAAELALSDYVAYLRHRGAPPEAVVICVKKLLGRSAIADLPADLALQHRYTLVSRCISAYYRSHPMRAD